MQAVEHTEREHSIVGASGYSRWSKCPGSVARSKGYGNTTSVYAAEGTLAHEISDQCLKDNLRPSTFLDTRHTVAGFDFTVSEEMVDAVDLYVSTVRDEYDEKAGDWLFVEHRFHLERLHPALFGTNDAGVYHPAMRKLVIFDLKYGAGIRVAAENNGQLLYYAIGAMEQMGPDKPVDEIEIVIVQPRGGGEPVKRWSLSLMELFAFAGDLVTAVERTEDPNALLASGEHCRFCAARGDCPQLREDAFAAARADFSPLSGDIEPLPTPAQMPVQSIAQLLDAAHLIGIWIGAVQEHAFAAMSDGTLDIPEWKLVPKRAVRRWINPEDAMTTFDSLGLGAVDYMTEPKLRTPAQVEKLLAKGDRKVVADLVTAESSGMSLAPSSDHREDLRRLAERDFDPVDPAEFS